jgi:hypothetical protein
VHGAASCGTARSACGSARALRIASRTARPLEDRPAALNGAAWTGTRTRGCTGALRRYRTWRWSTVDRPRTRLRHDDAPNGSRYGCGFRSLRRRCSRRGWRCNFGCQWRRRRRRSCGRWWRSRSSNRRASCHRVRRRRRGNRRALLRGGGCSRRRCHWRTGHHWPGGRFRCNGRGRRRRRGHNRGRLPRLRHNDATRWSFGLGHGGSRRCSGRRWWRRAGSRLLRRSLGLCDRRRRGSLRSRCWAFCLFLTLLDRLQNVAGLRHPRPVDLRGGTALCLCRRAAVAAAPALEVRAHALRLIRLKRAGVRLRVCYADFLQHIQNGFTLDFELSC